MISPDDLRSFLLSIPAFKSNIQEHALLNDKRVELEEAKTVHAIFDVLTEWASVLNHDIFQKIMSKYNIAQDQDLNYYQHFETFTESFKISEFMMVGSQLRKKFQAMIVKLEIENTCSLATIFYLKDSIAEILELDSAALQFANISDGYEVTFHIPTSIANAVFTSDKTFTALQKDKFNSLQAYWLECNNREKGRHIYSTQKNGKWSILAPVCLASKSYVC